MIRFLSKSRNALLVGGLLLSILGLRVSLGMRFVVNIPFSDDIATVSWLQQWAQGIHNWAFITQRHVQHPMELYFLASLGQYALNGYWDARFDFLVLALFHTAYAAVVILTFCNLLTARDRGWLLTFIFVLFTVPFAGYRISWGNGCPVTALMLFSIWALYLAAFHGQSWSAIIAVCLLVALASINQAAGCLGGFMVAAVTLFRAALARRLTPQAAVVSVICLAIFIFQFLPLIGGGGEGGHKVGLLEAINAFLKALAWPTVFLPGIGLLTLAPLAGLVAAQIFLPAFRQNNVAFITGVGGLIFMIAIATGAFRGDNNNSGMPSGRYEPIFAMTPLFCAVALCLLYRGTAGWRRRAWGIFAYGWLCLQIIGFSIHIFYHVMPFVTRESGEWNVDYTQTRFRDVVRGEADIYHAPPSLESYMPDDALYDVVEGKRPMPAMTIPMVTGFPLQAGSRGNYLTNAIHPGYEPRPGQLYWSSFNLALTNKSFLSGPFQPQADYITVDLLLDKKARLTNYRLTGLRLTLIDETTGRRVELLPRLKRTFPFVFRDWESVYARVTPGHEYRLESSTTQPASGMADATRWLAFGEPFESGRMTPFIEGFGQSGKLLCFCGAALLTLWVGVNWWLGSPSTEANTRRS